MQKRKWLNKDNKETQNCVVSTVSEGTLWCAAGAKELKGLLKGVA